MSPGADLAVATVLHTDDERAVDRATLWLLELGTGQSRPLTDGGGIDASPSWLPEGRCVVYRCLREGVTQARWVDVYSGTGGDVPSPERGVGAIGPIASPDGARVAYTAPPGPARDPSAPYRVTELFWRMNGVGLLDDAVGEVVIAGLDGSQPRPITGWGELVLGLEWAPDGRRLAVLSVADRAAPRCVLRVVDAEPGGGVTDLYSEDFQGFPPVFAWLPDGRIVRSTDNRMLFGQPPRLVIASGHEPDAGRLLPQPPGWPFGVVPGDFPWAALQTPRLVVAPQGHEVYLAVQTRGRVEPWAVPVDEDRQPRPLAREAALTVPLDATRSKALVARSTMHEPPELWTVPTTAGGPAACRRTRLSHDVFAASYFDVHPLSLATEHGEQFDAWFLRPRHVKTPAPTLLNIHGGPQAAWGHAFSFDNSLLASAGYATLLVNQRGSTGYSTGFAQAINGYWGTIECDDLLAAVNAAVAAGLADPNALGVWGISAGAYLTARLITTTDRFTAAVVESPCLNLEAMLASDLGWRMGPWFGADPGQGLEPTTRLAAQAPTTDASRCSTPTLIIQHDNDLRTPPINAELFFTGLRQAGCPAEMLRLPTTSHPGSTEPGDPRSRVAQNEALLDWFARHIPRPDPEPGTTTPPNGQ